MLGLKWKPSKFSPPIAHFNTYRPQILYSKQYSGYKGAHLCVYIYTLIAILIVRSLCLFFLLGMLVFGLLVTYQVEKLM